MELTPRNYILLQRPLRDRTATPEVLNEYTNLHAAKKGLLKLMSKHVVDVVWLAKNGRTGHCKYNGRDEIYRVYIRRKRRYLYDEASI